MRRVSDVNEYLTVLKWQARLEVCILLVSLLPSSTQSEQSAAISSHDSFLNNIMEFVWP